MKKTYLLFLLPLCFCSLTAHAVIRTVEVEDLSDVTHDPLLASLRQRLRRDGAAPRQGRMGLRCVFSRESVAAPVQACDAGGSGADISQSRFHAGILSGRRERRRPRSVARAPVCGQRESAAYFASTSFRTDSAPPAVRRAK